MFCLTFKENLKSVNFDTIGHSTTYRISIGHINFCSDSCVFLCIRLLLFQLKMKQITWM